MGWQLLQFAFKQMICIQTVEECNARPKGRPLPALQFVTYNQSINF